MLELTAKSPCSGLLPMTIGAVTLTEMTPQAMTSLAPRKGQEAALSDALKGAHGMVFPAPGRATGRAEARAVWFGRGVALLIGPVAEASLAEYAALTDQTDAWAVVRIEGDAVEDVLARVIPVDLRAAVFKRGHTARTQLMHMSASVTRIGDTAFQIMVFRSMAATLVHDLETAMRSIAARR